MYIIHLLNFVKKILFFVIKWIVVKPSKIFTHLFFYKVIVKAYSFYLSFIRKIGWGGMKNNPFSFVLSQKFVHVVVIFLTTLLIFINQTTKTHADEIMDIASQTILSELIQSEFAEFEEDEQLIIETFDREAIISEMEQSYLDNLSSFRSQPKVSLTVEDEDTELLEVVPTTEDGANIVRHDTVKTEKIVRPRTEIVKYTIKSGDSISTIAEEFGVSASTILWENNLSSYSIIRPGQTLDILPMSGISHTVSKGESLSYIVNKYKIEEEKILEQNNLNSSSKISVGQKLLIPNGQKAYVAPTPQKTYTGIQAIKEIVTGPDQNNTPANKMAWPTVGRIITQYYSWKHHGLDIANKTGTPIYAADAGTIETIGWGTGYGNQIVINHGGGKKTRYAHLSAFGEGLKKGSKVTKGQHIAAMGSTGWSTGPHIHFEVIINGVKYNPLNYIK